MVARSTRPAAKRALVPGGWQAVYAVPGTLWTRCWSSCSVPRGSCRNRAARRLTATRSVTDRSICQKSRNNVDRIVDIRGQGAGRGRKR